MKEEKEGQDIRPGYDKKWVKDLFNVASEVLECEWCHGVARNNRELSCCGILACFGCLVQNKKCPQCLKTVDPFSLKTNIWANTRIESIAAICPFAVNEGETLCNWGKKDQKELSETDSHVKECPAVEVACEICAVKVQRCHITQHIEHSGADHLLKLRDQLDTLRSEAAEGKELKETMEKKIKVLEKGLMVSKKDISSAFRVFSIVCLVFLCSFIILFMDKGLQLVSKQTNNRSNQEYNLDETVNSKLAGVIEQLITSDLEFKSMEKRLRLVSNQLKSTNDSISEQLATFFNQKYDQLKNMESDMVEQKAKPLGLDSVQSHIENSGETLSHWLLYSVIFSLLYFLRMFLATNLIPSRFPWVYFSRSTLARFLNVLLGSESSSLYWLCYWHAYPKWKPLLNENKYSKEDYLKARTDNGDFPLYQICCKNNYSELKPLLDEMKFSKEDYLKSRTDTGDFPLYQLCLRTKYARLKPLLDEMKFSKQDYLKSRFDNGDFPLSQLCFRSHSSKLMPLLVEMKFAKEDFLKSRHNGEFPLYWLCFQTLYSELKPLLDELYFSEQNYLQIRELNSQSLEEFSLILL